MRDTDSDWRKWGEQEPYFGVYTDDRFRSDNIAKHREDFFASGEHCVDRYLKLLELNFGTIGKDRALDFGCGVGRLSAPLSRRFEEVVGVDISPAMLAEAKKNAPGATFVLSDDELSRVDGTFNLVFSFITIQHIPQIRGRALINILLSKASEACCIHISVGRKSKELDPTQNPFRSSVADLIRTLPGGKALMRRYHGQPQPAQGSSDPVLIMHEYRLPDVLPIFRENGFRDPIMVPSDHGGEETVMLLSRRS